jgi:hypothetical protein
MRCGPQEHTATFLQSAPNSTSLDLAALFTGYDQFSKRCRKLVDMFSTVHQFTELGQHTHIEGIDAIMAKFSEVGSNFDRLAYVPGASVAKWRSWQLYIIMGQVQQSVVSVICNDRPAFAVAILQCDASVSFELDQAV